MALVVTQRRKAFFWTSRAHPRRAERKLSMIADLMGPRPHYLVLAHSADRRLGSIRAASAYPCLARGYLMLLGRRSPHSSTRRRGGTAVAVRLPPQGGCPGAGG